MKTKILIILTCIINLNLNAQFGPQQIISTNANSASSVSTADIDGDGDMDVLSASFGDDKIAWYENDGQGNFGSQQIISINADGAYSVYAADFDSDGDLDVLSASQTDDKIAWYENTDGLGNFGNQQIIVGSTNDPLSVYATDIDGDGDMDFISASMFDDKVAWYENTDGLGNFGPQQIITTNADAAHSVYATDIDGDGDIDVLSASSGDNKIAWYENTDGQGNFGAQQIISVNAILALSVFSIDIDGDGDMDVLSASRSDNKVAWYENTTGLGNFGPEQIITTNAIGATSVHSVDIDGDGDMDVLSACAHIDAIAWYENTDGQGGFGPQQIITTNAVFTKSVVASDLDGDGDMDVLSASYENVNIAWYENQHPLSINENILLKLQSYPNPTNDFATISLEEEATYSLINIQGRILQQGQFTIGDNTLDVSQYARGLYFINVKTVVGNTTLKLIKK